MEWFNEHKIAFELHDYKTSGIAAEKLQAWCGQKGWETILNKRSTTWRGLNADAQAAITNENEAVKIMLLNTSLIKRPVIELDGNVMAVGVDKKKYKEVFTPIPYRGT